MIQAIGVVVAAIMIYIRPEWSIADPICSFAFTVLVLITTIPIFLDCLKVLLETSPF